MTSRSTPLFLSCALGLLSLAACSSSSSDAPGSGGAGSPSGGTSGTGGVSTSTGAGGSAGQSGSGGASARGGSGGAGGIDSNACSGQNPGNPSCGGATGSGGKTAGAGGSAPTGGTAQAGSTGTAGHGGLCSTCAGGTTGKATGGAAGTSTGGTTGGAGAGGMTGSTGGAGAGGTTAGGGSTGSGLPWLTVNGTKLQDPAGKTIILRGSSLIDIGALYVQGGNNIKGITDRMDKLAAAGVQGHVVRFPVYPKIDYNAGYPYCSELPYPVGTGPGTSCTAKSPMSAADYVSKVLEPAIAYATSKNLYVIIDHHQIDDITKGTSAADATTFWTDIAPRFADNSNVLYEPFNEPIDGSSTWSKLKPVVQGWIDTIRKAAPKNIIIVPSHSYCQHPGDAASDPPTDPSRNLMYTAHVYPGNWNTNFKQQVVTAVAKAPVFFTEWGYVLGGSDPTLGTSDAAWGTNFRAILDADGSSWTAWVTDNSWTPNMFSDSAITKLTDFGTLTKTWLAAKANSDWIE